MNAVHQHELQKNWANAHKRTLSFGEKGKGERGNSPEHLSKTEVAVKEIIIQVDKINSNESTKQRVFMKQSKGWNS